MVSTAADSDVFPLWSAQTFASASPYVRHAFHFYYITGAGLARSPIRHESIFAQHYSRR